MLAQSLRRSIRQAVRSGRSPRAIPNCYCSHAIDAGHTFQYLIGEITGHEGFVNFVEIGDTIVHGNLRRIPSPAIWYILEGFGTMTYVTLRDISERNGAPFAELVRFSRRSIAERRLLRSADLAPAFHRGLLFARASNGPSSGARRQAASRRLRSRRRSRPCHSAAGFAAGRSCSAFLQLAAPCSNNRRRSRRR